MSATLISVGDDGKLVMTKLDADVEGPHSLQQAYDNLLALLRDIEEWFGVKSSKVEIPEGTDDPRSMSGTKYSEGHDGRYPFYVTFEGQVFHEGFPEELQKDGLDYHLIEIPGIPLDEVRYLYEGDIFAFPRIFHNGSSWIWPIGAHVIADAVTGLQLDYPPDEIRQRRENRFIEAGYDVVDGKPRIKKGRGR